MSSKPQQVVPYDKTSPESLDRRMAAFSSNERQLVKDFQEMRELYLKTPAKHPDFTKEWSSFYTKKCQLDGKRPNPATLKNEWEGVWTKIVESSIARTLDQEREKLRQSFGISPEDEKAYSIELKIPKRTSRSSSPESRHHKKKSKKNKRPRPSSPEPSPRSSRNRLRESTQRTPDSQSRNQRCPRSPTRERFPESRSRNRHRESKSPECSPDSRLKNEKNHPSRRQADVSASSIDKRDAKLIEKFLQMSKAAACSLHLGSNLLRLVDTLLDEQIKLEIEKEGSSVTMLSNPSLVRILDEIVKTVKVSRKYPILYNLLKKTKELKKKVKVEVPMSADVMLASPTKVKRETESKSGIISKPIKVPTATLTAPPTAPETRATESNSNQKPFPTIPGHFFGSSIPPPIPAIPGHFFGSSIPPPMLQHQAFGHRGIPINPGIPFLSSFPNASQGLFNGGSFPGVSQINEGFPLPGVSQINGGEFPFSGVSQINPREFPFSGVSQINAGFPLPGVSQINAGFPVPGVSQINAGFPVPGVSQINAGFPVPGVSQSASAPNNSSLRNTSIVRRPDLVDTLKQTVEEEYNNANIFSGLSKAEKAKINLRVREKMFEVKKEIMEEKEAEAVLSDDEAYCLLKNFTNLDPTQQEKLLLYLGPEKTANFQRLGHF